MKQFLSLDLTIFALLFLSVGLHAQTVLDVLILKAYLDAQTPLPHAGVPAMIVAYTIAQDLRAQGYNITEGDEEVIRIEINLRRGSAALTDLNTFTPECTLPTDSMILDVLRSSFEGFRECATCIIKSNPAIMSWTDEDAVAYIIQALWRDYVCRIMEGHRPFIQQYLIEYRSLNMQALEGLFQNPQPHDIPIQSDFERFKQPIGMFLARDPTMICLTVDEATDRVIQYLNSINLRAGEEHRLVIRQYVEQHMASNNRYRMIPSITSM